MRLRIWSRLAAAAVAAGALAGSASAQTPARAPVVVPQQIVTAQPAPGPTAPTVPPVAATPMALPGSVGAPPAAAAATPVAPAPGATVVTGNGGCTNCGPAGTSHRGFVMNATGGYLGTNCRLGQPCNNGCGSFRSDTAMLFGSCRSFFAPCGPAWGGKHGAGGTCNHPVLNGNTCGPFNPCVYDSYLNH